MIIIVIAIFAVCWFPTQLILLLKGIFFISSQKISAVASFHIPSSCNYTKRPDWKTWTSRMKASYLWIIQICHLEKKMYLFSNLLAFEEKEFNVLPSKMADEKKLYQSGKLEIFKDIKVSLWMFMFFNQVF